MGTNFLKKGNKTRVTHGMSNTRIHKIWRGIKNRCNNGWHKRAIYNKITYNPKWETFVGFYEDMKEGYEEHLTIDRIDNNGNYCKENCRWATVAVQNRNHSRNVNITIKGVTKCLTDWCNDLDITIDTIYRKVKHKGYTYENAIKYYIK